MSSYISHHQMQPLWRILPIIMFFFTTSIAGNVVYNFNELINQGDTPLLALAEANLVRLAQTSEDMPYSKNTYTYKVIDNCKIRADVYRLDDQKIRPVIMWIHGGALIIGTRSWLNSTQLKMYIKAGFTVVSIDYRLAPETKLVAIVQDIEDAYQWIRSEGPELFHVDPDRIAIAGGSAGGYLTLTAGFRVKPRPRALISFYGYGDISGDWYAEPDSFYNLQPEVSKDQAYQAYENSAISHTNSSLNDKRHKFYLYCRQKGLWPQEVTGHDPRKDKKWFTAYEPVHNVTSTYPPTLLLHGLADTDVPYQQSVQMAEKLKHEGVDYEFISDPAWGHGFDGVGRKDPKVSEALDRLMVFLNKHLLSK